MAPTRMGVDGLESHVCRSKKPFKFLNPIRLKMYTAHITTEYETVSRPGSTAVQSHSQSRMLNKLQYVGNDARNGVFTTDH